MPFIPRLWFSHSSEVSVDGRVDSSPHEVDTPGLVALSKYHGILGMEPHTVIGEQCNMFHIREPSNTQDVVWCIRSMFNICKSHCECVIVGIELHLDRPTPKSPQWAPRDDSINLRRRHPEVNEVSPILCYVGVDPVSASQLDAEIFAESARSSPSDSTGSIVVNMKSSAAGLFSVACCVEPVEPLALSPFHH